MLVWLEVVSRLERCMCVASSLPLIGMLLCAGVHHGAGHRSVSFTTVEVGVALQQLTHAISHCFVYTCSYSVMEQALFSV